MGPERRVVKEWLKAVDRLSQVMQSAALVNQLRPFPQPAYITASPYQTLAGYGLCHCSTGTGTGTGTVTP